MWDDRYSASEYVFGTEPADFLRAHTDLLTPGLTALAVADGEGRNSVFLAEQGVQVTAMDASPVGLAKAAALAADKGVQVDFRQADVMAYDWDAEQYDLVVAIFIQFMGPNDRDIVFEGLKRAVKPGGRILLHGYTPKQLEYGTGGPPILENLYTDELLRQSFGDFTIERLESYEAELREGTGHVGQSAIVDLVARRPQ